jgi:SAM-dependent methyltransferase
MEVPIIAGLEWLCGTRARPCPTCAADSQHARLLAVHSVAHPRLVLTFLRCAACGAVFAADPVPPPPPGDEHMVRHYVELGAGIDTMVEPLLCLPAAERRLLDVGCGFGFALDFARRTFACEVVGVDPSHLARVGGEQLGVPIVDDRLRPGLELGGPFDLVLLSEVLEHAAAPRELLQEIRDRMAPDGILALTTPNARAIRPDGKPGVVQVVLSPGHHLVLFTAGALERLLHEVGFAACRIDEQPHTLRAYAAARPPALDRVGPPRADGNDLLRRYFAERAGAADPGSSLAWGFAYRHFKTCVNIARFDDAVVSWERLRAALLCRSGLDLERPEDFRGRPRPDRRQRAFPAGLHCALYLAGVRELNARQRPARAAAYFAAAIAVGETELSRDVSRGIVDSESAELLDRARMLLPMAVAPADPLAAMAGLRELARLESRASFPAELLREARARVFVGLVNASADDAAQRLAPAVSASLAPLGGGSGEGGAADAAVALDCVFCLGVLALRRQRAAEAAAWFGLGARLDRPGPATGGRPHLLRECREAEALALETLGERTAAARLREALRDEPAGTLRTAHQLDVYWCDANGSFVRGWLHAFEHPVRELRIEQGGRLTRVEHFHERPDLAAIFPGCETVRHGGFEAYLPGPPTPRLRFTVATDHGGSTSFEVELPAHPLPVWPRQSPGNGEETLYQRFLDLARAEDGWVLEIGARSHPGGSPPPYRHDAHRLRIIGLDIHAGPGVDIVGDAHALSQFLRPASFAGVFSMAVLEHLAQPWRVAAEIHRVLRPGGLVFHSVPAAWPPHAQPADYWRFSDAALRVLFGRETGFEVLASAMQQPVVITPGPSWRGGHLDMPALPAFGEAVVLARKIPLPAEEASSSFVPPREAEARRYPLDGLVRHQPGSGGQERA